MKQKKPQQRTSHVRLSSGKSLTLLGNVKQSILHETPNSAIIFAHEFVSGKYNQDLKIGHACYPIKSNGEVRFVQDISEMMSRHPDKDYTLWIEQQKKKSPQKSSHEIGRLPQFLFKNVVFSLKEEARYFYGEKANIEVMEFVYRGWSMELIISKAAAYKNFSRVNKRTS